MMMSQTDSKFLMTTAGGGGDGGNFATNPNQFHLMMKDLDEF